MTSLFIISSRSYVVSHTILLFYDSLQHSNVLNGMRVSWLLALQILSPLGAVKYSDWAKPLFERQFNEKCSRYPFVEKFYRQFDNSSDLERKYVISVFR